MSVCVCISHTHSSDDIATATEAERRQQRYEERKELLKRREAGESPWDQLDKLWPEQPRS